MGEEYSSEKGGEDEDRDEEGLGEGEEEELSEELADVGVEGTLVECIEVMRETGISHEQSASITSQGSTKRKNMSEGKFLYYIYLYY